MSLTLLAAGRSGGSGGGSPTPGGLIGWWDASVFASLSLSGTDILSIADQSGGGNTISWVNAKPVYNSTGLNGRPAFTFNNASRANAFTNTSFPMGTGNTLTVWYVGYFDTTLSPGGAAGVVTYTGAGQTADWNNTNSWAINSTISNNNQITLWRNTTFTNINCTANTPHRVIVTIDSSGVQTVYIDGVATTAATVAGNWSSPGTLNIGRDKGGSYWSGPFGEVGISSAFTSPSGAASLDGSLKTKYGL